MKLMSAADVQAAIPGISERSARRIIGEVGRVRIAGRSYCTEDALERYVRECAERPLGPRGTYTPGARRRANPTPTPQPFRLPRKPQTSPR